MWCVQRMWFIYFHSSNHVKKKQDKFVNAFEKMDHKQLWNPEWSDVDKRY
jgi:hypothetical protein